MQQKTIYADTISKKSNILVIESAFSKSSVGLYQCGKIEIIEGDESLKHSDYLLKILEKLLTEHQFLNTNKRDLKKLDAIITTNGPGSFTALRVGASIAKAFSYGLSVPIIPISSLAAITQSALSQFNLSNQIKLKNKKNRVVTLMDARVRGIYTSIHQVIKKEKKYSIQKIADEKLIELDHLKKYLTQNLINNDLNYTNYFLAGNAFSVYQAEMDDKLTQFIKQKFSANLDIKSAKIESLIELALKTPKNLWQDGLNFQLNYLRNKVANLAKNS